MSAVQKKGKLLFPRSTKEIDPYGETFQDVLREWLKEAPWLLVSLVIHLVAGLIIANIDWQTVRTDEVRVIQASYDTSEVEPLPPEQPEKKKPKETETPEAVPEEPMVTDTTIFEEEPTPVDQQPIQTPFDANNLNDVIGVGGGAGPRFGGVYSRRIRHQTSNRATERAVEWGLDWLRRHQSPEGYWDCDGFDEMCQGTPCTGHGQALNDPGVTGLALLAFLGTGNTPLSGPYREVVRKGLRYLCRIQDPDDGCLSDKSNEHYMYNHAIATLALTEAYGLSHWIPLKKHVLKALHYIHETRNPGRAWRYNLGDEWDPTEKNDVSVTGWMVMCLASAADFGLPVDKQDLVDALKYIDDMTDTATGRTGYKERGSYSSREPGDELIWPFEKVEAMTAVAMLCRVFIGNILGNLEAQQPMLEKGAALLMSKPPAWKPGEGTIDYYYWYYGSYAMFQMGGKYWRVWKDKMVQALTANQATKGCARGSWDPAMGPWGDDGGRIYSTALATLCLEAFYRYDNILGAR